MEWAIFIPRVDKLHLLEDSWIENAVFRSMRVKEIIQKLSGQVHFTRMYFGEEFCERAIPSFQDVQKASEVALNYGLEFTLVTPYVTERGLGRLRKIFSGLLELGRQCEVIINDWGVLHLLSREYPDFIPVIGRQLNKAWRDPRCKNSAIPLTSLESEVMKNILKEKQANRIELDIPPQGLENLAIEDYELSLYFPYSIITSGRMCLIGSWGYDKSDKFKANNQSCHLQCRRFWLELTDKSKLIPKSNDWKIVQKGNAIFCVLKEDFLKNNLIIAMENGVDRLIFQPEPI